MAASLDFTKGKNPIELPSECEIADTLRKALEAEELGELDRLIKQQERFCLVEIICREIER